MRDRAIIQFVSFIPSWRPIVAAPAGFLCSRPRRSVSPRVSSCGARRRTRHRADRRRGRIAAVGLHRRDAGHGPDKSHPGRLCARWAGLRGREARDRPDLAERRRLQLEPDARPDPGHPDRRHELLGSRAARAGRGSELAGEQLHLPDVRVRRAPGWERPAMGRAGHRRRHLSDAPGRDERRLRRPESPRAVHREHDDGRVLEPALRS